MACDHTFSGLYEEGGLSVGDFRCRAHASGAGDEEENLEDSIVFVRRGVFEKQVGSRSIAATPNSVVFYPQDEVHRTRHPISGGDDCTVITIEPETLRELATVCDPVAADRPDPFLRDSITVDPALFLRQLRLFHTLRRDAPDPVGAQENLLDLCADVLSDAVRQDGRTAPAPRTCTRRAHRDLAHATATLLGSRFAESLTLHDIAREVHSSPYHLSRVFRCEMGLPIHRYLNRIRLRTAADRLAAGAPDLIVLALDVGFSSRGHFYDAFRAEFDVAPSVLRRELS